MCRIFLLVTLTAQRPKNPAYPNELVTIGDHLRKARLDRGLDQIQAAKLLGTTKGTVQRWETIGRTPTAPFMSRILTFIGYVPYSEKGKNFSQKLYWARQIAGLTQEELAKQTKVSPQTIMFVENNKRSIKNNPTQRKLERFIISNLLNFCNKTVVGSKKSRN